VRNPGGAGGPGGVGKPGGPGGAGGVGKPGGPGGAGGNRTNINSGNRNTVIAPITPVMPAYGWNGGYPWYPAPGYWGGGFWGAFAVGAATTIVFGEILDNETHEKVVSYEVAPDSPGANALKAYGLTQTQCNQGASQVVIFGPNSSVVCASPNSTVAAGEYELDTTNLTIYSRQ
jgi:hypothetical protein